MAKGSGKKGSSKLERSAAGKLRLEYLPAAQLAEHPSNWRLHPAEQMAALGALVDEVGWAGALLYNEQTGRLLDGHARRKLFADRGGEVPVLIGSWDEAAERKIVALLDSVGDMAEGDRDRLRDLLKDADLSAALRPAAEAKMTIPQPITVPVVSLKAHPRNYRTHPPEQLAHLAKSIEESGLYRPIVVARDHTILAGHGIWLAAQRVGLIRVPVIRLPLDAEDPRALKVLAADNESDKLGETDDRALSELLKEVRDDLGSLLGTGFDDMALANLLFTSRTQAEIGRFDEAAAWTGMPEYDPGQQRYALQVLFASPDDRARFVETAKLKPHRRGTDGKVWSAWWPDRSREDLRSVRWEEGADA